MSSTVDKNVQIMSQFYSYIPVQLFVIAVVLQHHLDVLTLFSVGEAVMWRGDVVVTSR